MIINKINKSFMSRSDKPNENWIHDDNYFVVPDNSDLYSKVLAYSPNIDFVLNEDGDLIDIVETPKSRLELIDEELAYIDSQGVTRHLENQIEASGTYNTIYESTRKLIDRKNELREERKTLIGGNANAENNVNE